MPAEIKHEWYRKNHEKMRIMYNLPKDLRYREKMSFLSDSIKVSFVRHPFVRLVSTYQDKIVDHIYYR